ncbi:MAG: hypothetical protein ORN98_00270 [Alphaproteobacteria bacterium]|nr:hypothetical protein [Alphaproteobacteria bacterium]
MTKSYLCCRKFLAFIALVAVCMGLGAPNLAQAAEAMDYEPDPVSQTHIWVAGSYQGFTRQDGIKDKKFHSSYNVMAANFGYQHMTEFFGFPMRLSASVPVVYIGERSTYDLGRRNIGIGDLSLDALWWLISEPEIDRNLGVRLTLTPASGDYRGTLDANAGTGHMTTSLEIGYRYGIMGATKPIMTIEPVLGASFYGSQETYYMGPRLSTAPSFQPQLFVSSRPFTDKESMEFYAGIGAQLGGDLKYDDGTSAKGSNQTNLLVGARTFFDKESMTLRLDCQFVVNHEKTTPYAPGSIYSLKFGYKY